MNKIFGSSLSNSSTTSSTCNASNNLSNNTINHNKLITSLGYITIVTDEGGVITLFYGSKITSSYLIPNLKIRDLVLNQYENRDHSEI